MCSKKIIYYGIYGRYYKKAVEILLNVTEVIKGINILYQSLIIDTLFQIFSLILSAIIIYFIIKKLNINNYDLKISHLKNSAIISLIVILLINLLTVIIIPPLMVIFMKVFVINQLSGSMATIFFVMTGLLQITPLMIITLLRKAAIVKIVVAFNQINYYAVVSDSAISST